MCTAASSNQSALRPTTIGYIDTAEDGIWLLKACLSGALGYIRRFPQRGKTERLLRSGNIFVYADASTGPGHWDDGKKWASVKWEDGLHVEREHNGSDSLRKKSGTIFHKNIPHYLISYYEIKDALDGTLKRPSQSFIRASHL